MERTTKADHIMDDIAVFFVPSPRHSLVCDGIFRPTYPSLDHNQGSLAVAKLAPGSCLLSKEGGDIELDYAVYPQKKISRKLPVDNRIIS